MKGARTPERRHADGESEARRTRAHWDNWSDRYQASTGVQLLAAPAAWGAWRIPEAELRLLPDLAGKAILELGCGAAQWSLWLAQQGARVAGIDLSGRQLAHARGNIASANVQVSLIHGNAEALPFGDAVFDVVLSDHGAMSWGHPDRTVPEVARVLRPDGVLVFCVTSTLFDICWDDRFDRPGDRLRRDFVECRAEGDEDDGVSYTLSHGEWVRRFRAHRLAVDALLEPRPRPGLVSNFWPQATAWAQRWPAEAIWKVRREAGHPTNAGEEGREA
jgi:SAM-dependent methyltransferase